MDDQLTAFDDNFAEVDLARAQKANLTAYDVVIIASMIEKESQTAGERRKVAAVIWNRLKKDMLLQIDATVQYALGKTKPVLTFDDLEVDSPYNTYKHAGLPPTPISNPGLAALKAAADPDDVPYLYYVARNDGSGRHYFSSDLRAVPQGPGQGTRQRRVSRARRRGRATAPRDTRAAGATASATNVDASARAVRPSADAAG